jgi:glucose/arabinose dehydrogenase
MIPRVLLLVVTISHIAFAQLPPDIKSDVGADVPQFRVRPGYRVTRAAAPDALREARFLQFSEDGQTLFVSDRENGAIYALRNPDENGTFKTITTFLKDKRSAHGMDFRDGWIYFSQASEGSVSRARDTTGDGVADDVEVIIRPGSLPRGGGHPFIGLLVAEDAIYTTSSDPTNMLEELPSERKTIYVFGRDGRNKRVFCTGIRNTEKIRFRPGTREVWGFDHGSDNFGATYGERMDTNQPITDLNPPEELNHYVEAGFYGHPFITGNRIPRPEFARRRDILELAGKTIPPAWCEPAHWAINGFTFLSRDHFGADHSGDIFFASHGSWNAEKDVGACVQRVLFDKVTGKPCGSLTIVDCQGESRRFARPVDCAEAPDGTVIFSSDQPPGLFRISKSPQ